MLIKNNIINLLLKLTPFHKFKRRTGLKNLWFKLGSCYEQLWKNLSYIWLSHVIYITLKSRSSFRHRLNRKRRGGYRFVLCQKAVSLPTRKKTLTRYLKPRDFLEHLPFPWRVNRHVIKSWSNGGGRGKTSDCFKHEIQPEISARNNQLGKK